MYYTKSNLEPYWIIDSIIGSKLATVVAATNYKMGDTKRRIDWTDYNIEAICNQTAPEGKC